MRKRDLVIVAVALVGAILGAVKVFSQGILETGSWGLSFRQENMPPVGPASNEQLRKYDAVYLGNTEEPVIYLTFDAGYENGCTEQILLYGIYHPFS